MHYTNLELIRALQEEYEKHGERPVIVYVANPETEYSDISVEYNEDGDMPVVLLEVE